MPVYEFKCAGCGETYSEIRRMGDDTGVPCPRCGSTDTKKLISTFASISKSSSPVRAAATPSCSYTGGGG
jgi:putative FmdB family regulatory protein